MIESIVGNVLEYKKLTPEEMKSRGILGRLVGIIADTQAPTRNGRKYSESLWDKVLHNDLFIEKIKNRCCFGELGHPTDRTELDMSKIALCLAEVPKKGLDGKLLGVFDILNTPNGQILNALAKYGTNIGVSSRGSGDTFTNMDGQEEVDPESYEFECFDAVVLPAVASARPTYVTESINTPKKSIEQFLTEELAPKDEAEKLLMKESLDSMGIILEDINIVEDDAITCVVSNFGELDEPYYGISFILPDGKYLDMRKCKNHSDAEQCLADNGLSSYAVVKTGGSPTLTDVGAIRVDTTKYYIQLSDVQPTSEQYQSLLMWLDYCKKTVRCVEVYNQDGSVSTLYNFREMISDDIVNRIRRYYSSGKLYESKELNQKMQHEFTYSRDSKSIAEDVVLAGFDLLDNDEEELDNLSNSPSPQEVQPVYPEKTYVNIVYDNVVDEEPTIIIDDNNLENDETFDQDDSIDIIDDENAVYNGDELTQYIQDILDEKRQLEQDLLKTQDDLSAVYVRESKNESLIQQLRQQVSKLSEVSTKNKSLQQKVESLTNELSKAKENLIKTESALNDKISYSNKLTESVNSLKKSNKELKNSNDDNSAKYSKLTEQYNKLDSELNEQITNLQRDAMIKNKEFNERLSKATNIVEQYKKIAKTAVSRYIQSEALKIGVQPIEITNKLSENYTFKDIDNVVESLREHKLNVNSLPFSASGKSPKVVINESASNLIPKNSADEIDSQLLRLLGDR